MSHRALNSARMALSAVILLILFGTHLRAQAPSEAEAASPQETKPFVSPPPAPPALRDLSAEARWLEKLASQWDVTKDSLEAVRRAAEMADLRQAERLDVHIARMEERMASQKRENDAVLRTLQASTRDGLKYAGLFVGFGFLAVFMLSLLQWRATVRLTQMVLRPVMQAVPQIPAASAVVVESAAAPIATQRETLRMIESLERLEKRIQELESAASGTKQGVLPAVTFEPVGRSGSTETKTAQTAPTSKPGVQALSSSDAETATSDAGTLSELPLKTAKSVLGGILGKGEALLQLGQPAEALTAFEEALRLDPAMVEGWVKKGSALERLDRMEDALQCYDHAIALDGSFTLAYLYKGGVCNRLERFDEALACYEQALRSHETAVAS
ncbi:MAG: tetratricopeptide repeat protein [Verrucomicrobia bacterium]|nr:tetratricopeptide repeat protein [Verrucomicrobiota bacterium]